MAKKIEFQLGNEFVKITIGETEYEIGEEGGELVIQLISPITGFYIRPVVSNVIHLGQQREDDDD